MSPVIVPGSHDEVDPVERADAVEAAVEAADLEQGHTVRDTLSQDARSGAVRARPPQSVRGPCRDGTLSPTVPLREDQ